MNEGDKAPDFKLLDQDGKPVALSDHKGETVVLYFYPRASTPGCTTQACGIRDRGADDNALGFTLVGDPDHAVAEAYGTWVEKSMYGKKYMGVERSTFIIGPDGKVAKVFPKVAPKKHDELVLKALGELAAA